MESCKAVLEEQTMIMVWLLFCLAVLQGTSNGDWRCFLPCAPQVSETQSLDQVRISLPA